MTDADSLLATFDHRAPYDIRCPPHSIAHAREIIATGRLCDAGDHDWIELDGEYWRECRACGIADVTAADVGQSIATPHAGWQRRRSARGRRMVAVGYVPTNPSVRVRGEYHYTALEDNDAFQALLARHDLQYDGARGPPGILTFRSCRRIHSSGGAQMKHYNSRGKRIHSPTTTIRTWMSIPRVKLATREPVQGISLTLQSVANTLSRNHSGTISLRRASTTRACFGLLPPLI